MMLEDIKVLHLSSFDIVGGAARAAYRIHQSLKMTGMDSQMLVQYKKGQDSAVNSLEDKFRSRLRSSLDGLPLKFYPKRKSHFSCQWLPDAIETKVKQVNPDIINLHWINNGYLSVETLAKFNKPIVWTLHDMWAFTGGCYYSSGCDLYQQSCGNCPKLNSGETNDLSRWNWQRKAKAWQNLNLTIVSPSSWLAKCASSSSLFQNLRVEVIPYGLDTEKFRPINQKVARERLGLPQDKQLVLFGSLHKRKGFNLLQPSLQELGQSGWQDKVELVIFGADRPENPPELGLKAHYLGTFSDDFSLSLVYSAADVFVLPSTEDNLPNTILEAIACGTPCVAFDIGGMPDMIEPKKNGYLAQPYKIEDLAQGITWILENKEHYQQLRSNARKKSEREFKLELQASRYRSLFEDILTHSSGALTCGDAGGQHLEVSSRLRP